MGSQKHIFRAMKYLSFLTQVGLSILTPILLCVLAAVWLQNRFGLGNWVVVVGILLGVGGGFCSLFQFFQFVQREGKKEREEQEDKWRRL